METRMRMHVGVGWHAGGVTLFPVWTEGIPSYDVVLGAAVEAHENDGRPTVGQLVVANQGVAPALLLEGEILEGGWQDRALVHDVLVMPGTAVPVPVACVEAGRWHGAQRHQRKGRVVSPSVRNGLRADEYQRQGEVWRRVSRFDATTGRSGTDRLGDHLERAPQRAADEIPMRPLDGQRGVVVCLGGRPVSLELMPSHQALCEVWSAIVGAAMLDATLLPPRRTPGQLARDFVAQVGGLHLRPGQVSGVGRLVHGERGPLEARGIASPDGAVIHLATVDRSHAAWAAA